MPKPPRVLISAPHRSSGKSTVSLGLCAALRRRGLVVQPFKKGPDYIDPMWLSAAAARSCRNLDFYLMGPEAVTATLARAARGADLCVIEGNMGFFGGMDPAGSDSTAALARLVSAPAVLVINTRGMTRGVAALVRGHLALEPGTPVAGVILNRVRGRRHEDKLRDALARYTPEVRVLGAVPDQPEVLIRERHLGLVPVDEDRGLLPVVERAADLVSRYVDLDRLLETAASAPPLPRVPADPAPPPAPRVRLGVARDRAFTFYYAENLEALARAGAELVPVDLIRDTALPDVRGLYIGGGFPEVFMAELEANAAMRRAVRDAAEAGMPVYAECGGLLYLGRSITYRGRTCAMAGVLPLDATMHARPMGHGYMLLECLADTPWCRRGARIRAHEFHHSRVESLGKVEFAYGVARGRGVDGRRDGILYKNVLASYAHLHGGAEQAWARGLVSLALSWR